MSEEAPVDGRAIHSAMPYRHDTAIPPKAPNRSWTNSSFMPIRHRRMNSPPVNRRLFTHVDSASNRNFAPPFFLIGLRPEVFGGVDPTGEGEVHEAPEANSSPRPRKKPTANEDEPG